MQKVPLEHMLSPASRVDFASQRIVVVAIVDIAMKYYVFSDCESARHFVSQKSTEGAEWREAGKAGIAGAPGAVEHATDIWVSWINRRRGH